MMRKTFVALAALLISTSAIAQTSVKQSGASITPFTVPYWVSNGIIGDSVSSDDSPISSFGVTKNGGNGICVSSQRNTAAGRQQLCLGVTDSAAATVSLQNYGTDTPQNLNFVINGTAVVLPTGGGSFATLSGSPPYNLHNIVNFNNTNGVLGDSGLTANGGIISAGTFQGTPVDIPFGGTNASTATAARTNLGLGTISTQNANNVAITGGAITGMPSPLLSSDVATKSYVDATSTGLNILAPSTLATAAILPNSPTYSNGSSGVGATLTAGSNTTLTVDSTAAPLNTVVLVKNQAAPAQNGIYTVTTAGDGSHAWVLTRASYFDVAAQMKVGSYTFITGGSVNLNSAYTLQSTVVTVGSDALTFVQFSAASTGTVTSATIAAGTGISVGGTCTITATGTCTVTNAGVTTIASNTGDFTLTNGITNSTNAIGLATIATGKMLANESGSTAAPTATSIPVLQHSIFTGNGTFNTPSNSTTATVYKVTACAGGGGGGGANASGAAAGGGSAGACGIAYLSGLPASEGETVTIGGGGAAGSTSAGNGGPGGTSSFATVTNSYTLSCPGGGGGAGSGGGDALGGLVGSCSGTNISAANLITNAGSFSGGNGIASHMSGLAGGCPFGSGGTSLDSNGNANPGVGFCAGGSGAFGTTAQGATGRGGYVLVEYTL